MTWSQADEDRLQRFARIGARLARLQARAEARGDGGLMIYPVQASMPPEAASIYQQKMAEHRARGGGIHPTGNRVTRPGNDQADQTIRARHRVRVTGSAST